MSLSQEFLRKSVHSLLLLFPAVYLLLGKWPSVLLFAGMALPFIGLDYSRRKFPAIQKFFIKILGWVLRDHEKQGNKLCGASWAGLAACIVFSLFSAEIAVTAYVILVICDTIAALVGKSVKSGSFFEKSIAGSSAFFVSGIVVLVAGGIFFHSGLWFYLFGTFTLSCVTIMEARPSLVKYDDNFIIPVAFSVIMTFFDILWNYQY